MIKPILSKLNFAVKRTPKTERKADWRAFIPAPYKAVLLINADFEMAWAWQYSKAFADPLKSAKEKALQERENVPVILELCDSFNIPITWATVGHLFLDSCNIVDGLTHPGIPRLSHFENDFWRFNQGDWFQHDPASDYKTDPAWYCPDLIKLIIESKVKHEIGCHSFSHIDCRDSVCSPEVFTSELLACKNVAKRFGIELKSFVHPAHTIGNIKSLCALGFTSFRTDYENVLSYPVSRENGIWEIKNTAPLHQRNGWSTKYHIYRYKEIIDRAIRSNTVCCFWFHPSVEQEFINAVMSELFLYCDQRRDDILISTITDYIDTLQKSEL